MNTSKKQRTASSIYADQNRSIHGALAKMGERYDVKWTAQFGEWVDRGISGLSDLTLDERRVVLSKLAKMAKGGVINPGVPLVMREWKKGMREITYDILPSEDRQLRMIYGLFVDLGYEPRKLHKLVQRRYGVSHERFMTPEQLTALLNYLLQRLKKRRGSHTEPTENAEGGSS
jgi:hypothetical protein